jgi:hypothetical protein
MRSRTITRVVLTAALIWALPALGQSLRVPDRGEQGLDPSFARGWLAPDFDRFGFAHSYWKDTAGLAPQRVNWSYTLSERSSLGLSMGASRELDYDPRQLSVFGRYWFAQDWAVSAETLSREPTGLLRLQDFRIGVQRRF